MGKKIHAYQCEKCQNVMLVPATYFRGRRKTWDQPRECSRIKCDGKGHYLYTYNQ